MRSTPIWAAAATIACIVGLSACATTTDGIGVAVSSPGQSGSPSPASTTVDVAALDTGSYPTSPSPAFGTAVAPDPKIVGAEGQRIAEFVTLPSEIDPAMTEPGLPTGVMFGTKDLTKVFASDAIATAAGSGGGLVAGFFTSAGEPINKISDKRRSLTHLVIRYNSPAAATAAANAMNRAALAPPAAGQPARTPVRIAGLPGTLAGRQDGAFPVILSFTAHKSYVISTSVAVPPGQENVLEPLIRKSVELQVPLIDKFPPTPIVKGAKSRLKLDQNNILIYALPDTSGQTLGGLAQGVYGPRGMASIDGPEMYTVLQDNGSEHNAVWLSSVYRASTDSGAEAIEKAKVDGALSTGGYSRAASPKGLPIATCLTKDTATGQQNDCYVRVGRYVGSTYDRDLTTSQQMIAAQYVILTKADQSAN